MRVTDVTTFLAELEGVREGTTGDLVAWRYRGRLVARQLDDTHLVIRAKIPDRDALVLQSPQTFSVPRRFRSHMMVVADLTGDEEAIQDALVAAWELQRGADSP